MRGKSSDVRSCGDVALAACYDVSRGRSSVVTCFTPNLASACKPIFFHNLSRIERVTFASAIRNGPGILILTAPKRAARMGKQDLNALVSLTEQQETCALYFR